VIREGGASGTGVLPVWRLANKFAPTGLRNATSSVRNANSYGGEFIREGGVSGTGVLPVWRLANKFAPAGLRYATFLIWKTNFL
jgi:hypothetical protein